LLSLLLAIGAAAAGQSEQQAFSVLAAADLIEEDAVFQEIQRGRAAELTAQAVKNAEGKPLDLETVEALNQLLTEYGSELAGMGVKLDSIQRRIAAAQNAVAQRKNKYGAWSEAKGIIDFSAGNGGNPRIYNAVRLRPQVDSNTRVGFMLYMQNGLGTTSFDQLTVSRDEFYISTKFNLKSQPVNLTVGNFWHSRSPFTIYVARREDDTQKDRRHSFNGIIASAKLFGLNWQGFLARTADGNGSGFDRYFLYNYATAPISGGSAGLLFMRIADDPESANKIQGAYDATTVGLTLSRNSKIGGLGYNLSGEGNLCRLDTDRLAGPIATMEYALRAEGKLEFKIPLTFNYYAISDRYPTQYAAIQTIGENFLYQYDENPLDPYFIRNVKRWEWKVDGLRLGSRVKAGLLWNQARELTGLMRTFGYKGLELRVDLGGLPFGRGSSLALTIGEYANKLSTESAFKQQLDSLGLTRPVGGATVTVGYDLFRSIASQGAKRTLTTGQVPFVQVEASPIPGSTFQGRYRLRTDITEQQAVRQDLYRLEWRSSVASRAWLRVLYNLKLTEKQTTSKTLYVEYRSGF
jgi:hypothetical protein